MVKRYISEDGMIVILIVFILVTLGVIFDGCAGMEPASTDHHNRVPQVNCDIIRYRGQVREMCCEGERCVLTE
jgi:hypothetical protein